MYYSVRYRFTLQDIFTFTIFNSKRYSHNIKRKEFVLVSWLSSCKLPNVQASSINFQTKLFSVAISIDIIAFEPSPSAIVINRF